MLYLKEKFIYFLQKHNNNVKEAWEELKAREINEQVRSGQLRTQYEIQEMNKKIDKLFKNEIIEEYYKKDQN